MFVCELDGADSLYDYNFKRGELRIDESRNLNTYVARAAIAEKLQKAKPAELARIFRVIIAGGTCLESGLDSYYLTNSYGSDKTDKGATWRAAWEIAGGGVVCPADKHTAQMVGRKGFQPVVVDNSAWLGAFEHYGIVCSDAVLDSTEKAGRTETAPNRTAVEAVAEVWSWAELAGMTKGKEMPKTFGFDEMAEAESGCLGFYRHGGDSVWLRNDLGGDMLLQTALEEVGHYITEATDCSRDFQDFFMQMIVRFMSTERAYA